MANPLDKLPSNIPGRFYVDDSCTDCDLCREIAPGTFSRDDLRGLSFVYRQPVTPEEIALADEAMGGCPTNSIGDDGITSLAN